MKTLFAISLLLTWNFSVAQKQESANSSIKISIPYVPATLQLLADTGVVSNTFINQGLQKVIYTKVLAGRYKIQIYGQGQPPRIIDSVNVTSKRFSIDINIDGPCLFDHPKDYIPTCPQNHKDSIISIVYGLVSKRGDTFMKEKKDMKVKYAGCVMTGCDPQFYCKVHDIEF
jgi:hypothetical protein